MKDKIMEKFYNREKEIDILKNVEQKRLRIAIIGRRRIGKTTLVKKALKNVVVLFVPQHKSEKIIIKEWAEEYEFIPEMNNLRSLFDYLFKHFNNHIYFIDEFQNLTKINSSILSDFQYLIDKYDPRLVITGSLISMMKGIVENYKSPLYGRFESIIKLKELSPFVCVRWGRDMGQDVPNTVRLWSVIGGVPKYWKLFEKIGEKNTEEFIINNFIIYPRPLYKEIEIMLKEEFGKEHKIYFSILEAISQGRNSLGEISNYTGIAPTNLTKYIHTLRCEYEIIKRIVPLSRKRGIYAFNSNIFEFWFNYLYKYQHLLENENEQELLMNFKETFNSFVGRKFEDFGYFFFCRYFKDYTVCKWWDKNNEIDVIGVNKKDKELLAVEVKWKDLKVTDVKRIVNKLEEKLSYVKWCVKERKEKLGIFARKIDKRAKEWLKENRYGGWDLEDVVNLTLGN